MSIEHGWVDRKTGVCYRVAVKGLIVFMLMLGLIGIGLWSESERTPHGLPPLSNTDKQFLLRLARRQLEAVIDTGEGITVPPDAVPAPLRAEAACFVTLTEHGRLRGCILDSFAPHEPMYKNVMRNVILAATADPRFPPVHPSEVSKIVIEISVLNRPHPLRFSGPDDLLHKLHPGVDGVILKTQTGSSTYLPQVWESLPNPADFLTSLCEKQGVRPDCWRRTPPPTVEIYHVEHFSENDFPPAN